MNTELPTDLPGFLKPYLRIFLSIDVVGSTQFKQSIAQSKINKSDQKEDGINEIWLDAILEFYHQVSSNFFQNWQNLSTKAKNYYSWEPGPEPALWKAVGDELIFTKRITDHRQAYICVSALIHTAQNCRRKIKKHSNNIDLKCTAWIAGFPVNNKEVSLISNLSNLADTEVGDYIYENMDRLNNDKKSLLDFVGPSIDTGFRLGAFSSPRKCILSVDLAYLISHASGNLANVNSPISHFTYFYDGKHILKGVNNGKPYPIFWIDCSEKGDRLIQLEDNLEHRASIPHSDVKVYCEHYLEKNKDTHIMIPYIIMDKSGTFSKIPEHHIVQINKLFNYYKKEYDKISNEKKAALSGKDDNHQEVDLSPFFDELIDMLKKKNKDSSN